VWTSSGLLPESRSSKTRVLKGALGLGQALVYGSELGTGPTRVPPPFAEIPLVPPRYSEFWGPSWGTKPITGSRHTPNKNAEALVFKGLPQYAVRYSNPEPTD
jgi:hypothetical protein